MKYRVHRLDMKIEKGHTGLEGFLNSLTGEVIAIIPNVARTTLLQIYGVTSKVNFLLIVEKIA